MKQFFNIQPKWFKSNF